MTHLPADIAIIGAGVAGASLAAMIGDRARCVLIEAESQPGYHSTGRSAAFWSESYGGPIVQPLTTASGPWLADQGFLRSRGCIHIAGAEGAEALAALAGQMAAGGVAHERLDRQALEAAIPGLRPEFTSGLSEPTCRDIDVGALHGDFLRTASRTGARLLTDAAVSAISRDGGLWRITTRGGEVRAPILVNAAGAWSDQVAALAAASPIHIQPYRRTIAQLATDPPMAADMPLVMDALGRFYFKPEAGGRLWLSPHDETPAPAHDVAPEELDVAVAIDWFERAVDWRVLRRERAWAGLRSFAPDRVPVYGFDPRAPGFFWCAGQGGFGIQTAPAAAMLGAALLMGEELPDAIRGIDPGLYAPDRFSI
ncbi:NAD(P)/FAD-dependent oxidoreductase [Sphingomonas crusticola]|uniref:NAD(P)/FAD-dependent oxidoreductase n=1 Tax=Sphingomonas crusticola TaxID=1697973 RepID=UPI000E26AB21|nr:FAD-dependent oxidoreductase [Sphingomonas crusticola]